VPAGNREQEKERRHMGSRLPLIIGLVLIILFASVILASCGSGTTTTTAGPTTTAAGGAVDAAALYAEYCTGCHEKVPGGSVDEIRAITESGKEDMPGFGDQLSAEQIAALSAWVAAGGK
jgi:mono/diheme cytochrome c family protein